MPLASHSPAWTLLELGDRDDVAGLGLGELDRLLALHGEERADADMLAAAGLQLLAFLQRAAEDAGIGEAPHRAAMADLEDDRARPARAEPLGGGVGRRRLVAQRLHQPADALRARRRAEQDRDDLAGAGLLGEIGKDRLPVRHLVHQQLLEQGVVMVGELLEHLAALERLAVGEVGGDFLLLGAWPWR